MATNLYVTAQYPFNPIGSIIGPPYLPEVIMVPGYVRIVSPDIPSIYLNSVGYLPNWGQGGVGIYFSAPLTNGVVDSSQRGLHITDNLFVNGGVYSIFSYQTNVVVVWATNAFFAVTATNAPDGSLITSSNYAALNYQAGSQTLSNLSITGAITNLNDSHNSFIGGGLGNSVNFGWYNAVLGGRGNNAAAAAYSTVAGGYYNAAAGQYSFAAGTEAQALDMGSFVWADIPGGKPTPYFSKGQSTVAFRATGGFWVDGGPIHGDGSGLSGVTSDTATNSPDGNPMPWKSGTNVWTGTNTFTHTLNIQSNITVLGASGATSNVPMGGITLHFVNGFFTGATTP